MKKKKFIEACFQALDKLEIEDLNSWGGDPIVQRYRYQRLELLKEIGLEINSTELTGRSELLMKKIDDAIEQYYELTEYEIGMRKVLEQIRELVANSYDVVPGLSRMKEKLSEAGLAEDPKMLRYLEGIPQKYQKWGREMYSNIIYYSSDTNPEQRERVTEDIRAEFGITPKYTTDRFTQRAEAHFLYLFDRYLKKHLGIVGDKTPL